MKKNSKLPLVSEISNATQIPVDLLGKIPYIKMASNREITVEDAGKLVHYDETCVRVRQRKKTICICGFGLKLKCLANCDLMVTGYIDSVKFE